MSSNANYRSASGPATGHYTQVDLSHFYTFDFLYCLTCKGGFIIFSLNLFVVLPNLERLILQIDQNHFGLNLLNCPPCLGCNV